MENIKMKVNLVAVVTVIGAIIALIGAIKSWKDFGYVVNPMVFAGFALALIAAIINVKPTVDSKVALINVLMGVLIVVDSFMMYVFIMDSMVNGIDPMAVGWGPMTALTGSIIHLIFSISDYVFKIRGKN